MAILPSSFDPHLSTVNYSGSENRTELGYDALGRRNQIVEPRRLESAAVDSRKANPKGDRPPGRRRSQKSNGSVTGTKNFVWIGNRIAEERDASNNVAHRFYGQGEQIGGQAYFYTKDHLGSVRQLVNANGVVAAAYEYGPWGEQESGLPAGMQLWLKADVGVTTDGSGKVISWSDQSGKGNHATQGNAAARPGYAASAINGKPALTFDGSTTYLEGATAGFDAGSSDVTIIAVHKRDAVTEWGTVFSFNKEYAALSRPVLGWRNTTSQLGINNVGTSEAGTYVDMGSQAGQWQISTVSRKGGTNGNGGALLVRSLLTDGAIFQSSGTQGWTSTSGTNYLIGRHFLISWFLNGKISELLVFDHALSDEERTRVESYLAEKYEFANPKSSFRYTGHYFHDRSALHLTLYRGYDAYLGRWLSRDPLENAEMEEGPNLYQYVFNQPLGFTDPLGRDAYLAVRGGEFGGHVNVGVDCPGGNIMVQGYAHADYDTGTGSVLKDAYTYFAGSGEFYFDKFSDSYDIYRIPQTEAQDDLLRTVMELKHMSDPPPYLLAGNNCATQAVHSVYAAGHPEILPPLMMGLGLFNSPELLNHYLPLIYGPPINK